MHRINDAFVSTIAFDNVSKSFADVQAIAEISLRIEQGELVVFVGPSGCGKSTMLRLLAGLEPISSGRILINDLDVTGRSPKERNVAMVFQNYALYPHMSVRKNIAFSLKLQKIPKDKQDMAVLKVAAKLGLSDLLERKPRELSGGQRQRVAMGRAIVREPSVFLMDEPLSNLDAKLRNQMRVEIKQLQRSLKTTMVYVTHDQTEAMTMADRIAILNEGRLAQFASPETVYHQPANTFVADFIGSPPMNFFNGVLDDASLIQCDDNLTVPLPPERLPALNGEEDFTLGIRPEHIHVLSNHHPKPRDLVCWVSKVDLCEPLGGESLLHVSLGRNTMLIRQSGALRTKEGQDLRLGFYPHDMHIFSGSSGCNLSPGQRPSQDRSLKSEY